VGLILSPFALYQAARALSTFRASGINDENLHTKLKFLRGLAVFLVLFWATFAILELKRIVPLGAD